MDREAETRKRGRPRDPLLDAAIIDATLVLLQERGYGELTLTDVADRAGTTTAAIYRRWSSKSDLVNEAVFRPAGDDVVADTGDLEADLRTMVAWAAEKICRPAALAALAGLLAESRPDRAARTRDAAMASGRTAARFERAKAAGEIRADIDTDVLVALISGPVLHAAVKGDAADVDDAWIADLVGVVLRGTDYQRGRAAAGNAAGSRTKRMEAARR